MKPLQDRAGDWALAAEAILKAVDEATEPSKMTKVEARDSLRQLIFDIEVRVEALDEEIGDE